MRLYLEIHAKPPFAVCICPSSCRVSTVPGDVHGCHGLLRSAATCLFASCPLGLLVLCFVPGIWYIAVSDPWRSDEPASSMGSDTARPPLHRSPSGTSCEKAATGTASIEEEARVERRGLQLVGRSTAFGRGGKLLVLGEEMCSQRGRPVRGLAVNAVVLRLPQHPGPCAQQQLVKNADTLVLAFASAGFC